MCKKLCIAVGAVIVGLALISFTPIVMVVGGWLSDAKAKMDRSVPPETQLKNLNAEIDKIDGDIKKHLKRVAAMEVESEKLEANLTAMKEQQTKLRGEIEAMDKALDTKETKVSFHGRSYTKAQLALDLDSKVNTYEVRKAEIKTKDQLLTSKKQTIDLAHQQIAEMNEQKGKLRIKSAELERRIEQVKAKQAAAPVEVDATQVQKCTDLADKLDTMLSQQEREAELYAKYGFDQKKSGGSVLPKTKSVDDVRTRVKNLDDDTEEKVTDQK